MKIATWNVNSVRARLGNVTAWLQAVKPDILLMQEIKCEAADFPVDAFTQLGYQLHIVGQKAYHGVAIASLLPLDEARAGLPGDDTDMQARYAEATIKGVRIASLYLPNGNPVRDEAGFTEKYRYKLGWMQRLERHAATLLDDEKPVVLGGDFNVIPDAIDARYPEHWTEDALYRQETRAAWRRFMTLGYTDAVRALHPDQAQLYSFWDYQGGAWDRDDGIRIDHFLLSPEAVDRTRSCAIDRGPRNEDKASDHTPVILDIDA